MKTKPLTYLTLTRKFQTGFINFKKSQTTLPFPKMSQMSISKQQFDYFLVLDFEATCDDVKRIFPQEIIEFPCLKVNGQTFEVESTFHQYVEPITHKELSPFCTQLTNIIQDMVDGQPNIHETLKRFDEWMEKEGLLKPGVKSSFVTCGDWDLKTMLPGQCSHFEISYPDYLRSWINIKKVFEEVKNEKPPKKGDLLHMLQTLGIEHSGHYHSGIDDCKNIANILKGIAQTGYVFKQTGSLL